MTASTTSVPTSLTTPPPTTSPPYGMLIVISFSMATDCLSPFIYFTAEFDKILSPLNVTVEQQIALFHCQHRSSDDIAWRVNGTSTNSPHISTEKSPLSGGGYSSSLSIGTLLGFNETTIECVVVFYERSPFQFTSPVILLIQGVVSLVFHYVYISTLLMMILHIILAYYLTY